MAGFRKKPRTTRSACDRRGLDRRSDRRHPRLSRWPGRLGRLGRAALGGRPRLAALAGDRRVLLRGGRRGGVLRRRFRSRSDRGPGWRAREDARSQALPRLARRNTPFRDAATPGSVRWRCGSRVFQVRSMSPSSAATATIGTLRQPTFWCTKPGGALTDIDGEQLHQLPAAGACAAGCREPVAPWHGTCSHTRRRAQFV